MQICKDTTLNSNKYHIQNLYIGGFYTHTIPIHASQKKHIILISRHLNDMGIFSRKIIKTKSTLFIKKLEAGNAEVGSWKSEVELC